MDLKKLSDSELDAGAVVAAGNERASLVIVLQHLAEVDHRKSFSPRYETIHAYAVGHLGYDSKSAWRRVNAMKLMTELPEITPAIESGQLDLTKLVVAQNHFRNEEKATSQPARTETTISFFPMDIPKSKAPLTKAEKFEVLQAVMCQTSREAVRELVSKSSAPEKLVRPEHVKPLSGDANEVRLILSDEDLAVLRELKGLLAHKHPNASLGEIISVALNHALEVVKKEKSGEEKFCENQKRRAARERTRSDAKSPEDTRRPGRALQRKVWNRAGGICEICRSGIALEYDHRVPFAMGGKTTFENLRLTCRNCNQRESITIFGPHTIRCREIAYDVEKLA